MAIYMVENVITKEVSMEKGWISEERAWERSFGWKYKNITIEPYNGKNNLFKVIDNNSNKLVGLIKKVK